MGLQMACSYVGSLSTPPLLGMLIENISPLLLPPVSSGCQGAVKLMETAKKVGIRRFVLLSSVFADEPEKWGDPALAGITNRERLEHERGKVSSYGPKQRFNERPSDLRHRRFRKRPLV